MVTFKVEKNEKYGDYRVNQYINNVWENGNWSKNKAEKKAKQYRQGLLSM